MLIHLVCIHPRMNELTLASDTCYIVSNRIANLLVIEFTVLPLPTATRPMAILSEFIAYLRVCEFATFSYQSMFAIIRIDKEFAVGFRLVNLGYL